MLNWPKFRTPEPFDLESSTWSKNVPLLKTKTFDPLVKNLYSLRLGVIGLSAYERSGLYGKYLLNEATRDFLPGDQMF